jgi:ABC-type phosphate/phosphonate transport system substrate-binding protein
VIEVTEDIPNDGVQFIPDFDEEMKTKIVDALLAIAATEEGQEALDTAYQWTALEAHGDEFYDPFRQVLQASGMRIEDLAD